MNYICLDKLDVYSSLNGPTVEFNETTADPNCEWRLCKFIVKPALLLHWDHSFGILYFFTCKQNATNACSWNPERCGVLLLWELDHSLSLFFFNHSHLIKIRGFLFFNRIVCTLETKSLMGIRWLTQLSIQVKEWKIHDKNSPHMLQEKWGTRGKWVSGWRWLFCLCFRFYFLWALGGRKTKQNKNVEC